MFTDFYSLTEEPFQLTPDARFFYPSTVHARAKAYLTYGLQQGDGFAVITGEVDAGKTTLVSLLLNTLNPDEFTVGNIFTTHLSGDDTLRMVASVFKIPFEGCNKAVVVDRIYNFLIGQLEEDKRCLLIVDEAQNLTFEALEELRMLSNFQHNGKASLQFCLLGQPQFRDAMSHPDLEQFRQRIITSYHPGMDQRETSLYIKHRLSTVGWKGDPFLTADCLSTIFDHTKGIPRKINILCSRLFLLGELEELHELDKDHVQTVAEDLAQETAAITKPQSDTSPRKSLAEANLGSLTSLPATLSQSSRNALVPGDAASELADLRRRVEWLEKQAHQDQDKIVRFVTEQLKSLSESLGKLA